MISIMTDYGKFSTCTDKENNSYEMLHYQLKYAEVSHSSFPLNQAFNGLSEVKFKLSVFQHWKQEEVRTFGKELIGGLLSRFQVFE